MQSDERERENKINKEEKVIILLYLKHMKTLEINWKMKGSTNEIKSKKLNMKWGFNVVSLARSQTKSKYNQD